MRLQANGLNPYVYLFAYFLLFTMTFKVDGSFWTITPVPLRKYNAGESFLLNLSAWYIIDEELWAIIANPQQLHHGALPKVPLEGHRVVALCLTRMLTQSDIMMQEPNVFTWYNFHIDLVDVHILT